MPNLILTSRAPLVRVLGFWLGLIIVVAGCSGGPDRSAVIERFQQANPDVELTDDQAACAVDRLSDRYGLDGVADHLDAAEIDDGFIDDQFRDMFACGVTGDVETQLTELLVASGVETGEAPCVAEALALELDDDGIDVLLSGVITDDFADQFESAMAQCGAIG